MFQGLEHTAISSPNPEKLANWYVEYLGFRINFTYAGNFFVRAANGSLIEIIPGDGTVPPQTMASNKVPGIRHLAIAIDDFDAAYELLKSKGIAFLGEPLNNMGNRLAFFNDGDGNLLHLISRATPLP
jgi:catechol 2,3-dioxygenase-like lactoylglutathione lyase family enzyme